MSTNNQSKQRLVAILAVVIVALLGVNGVLLFNKYQQDETIKTQQSELAESNKLKAELDKQYYEALTSLEEMKTSNAELNTMIDQQKEELKTQKDKIAGLIRSNRGYKEVKAELEAMRVQTEGYVVEINRLKEEIEVLASENSNLRTEKESLRTDLEKQVANYQDLNNEKAVLVSEKENLMSENDQLEKTVNFASVVKVQNITVTGFLIKDSGKEVKKKNAKNVDRLEVCFETTVNRVADAGKEKFYVRILNPTGETMAIEDLGSGVTASLETNEEIRYTQKQELAYNNDEQQLCFSWAPNMTFQPGEYKVEVFNKGYQAGTGTFTLK